MIGGLLLLSVAVFGIRVLFGKTKPENLFMFAVVLIFAPVLLAVGYNHAVWYWSSQQLWIRILGILLVPFFFSAILRLMFPQAKWIQSFQTTVFQTLIYFITFPFRFLWRAGRFFFERERRTQRLSPYKSVVGIRPPLQNERREANPRANIFD